MLSVSCVGVQYYYQTGIIMVLFAEPQLETTVYPMMDQFIPANSEINVTFNCTVPSTVNIVWSINNTQIIADFQFDSFLADGYAIEPKNISSTFSTMTVSVADKNTQIACLPFSGGQCEDCTQRMYSIVPFGKCYAIMYLVMQNLT